MKKRPVLLGVVWCAVSLLVAAVPSIGVLASDYTLLPRPHTYWQESSALIISAYQREADGQDIALLEMYNDSAAPIDVQSWRITGVFGTNGVSADMVLKQRFSGVLSPKSHVVIDAGAGISNASFEMEKWSTMKPDGILTSLIMTTPGGSTFEYPLKFTEPTKTAPPRYDELWRRTPIQSGYSSSLNSFSTSTPTVYDDGLYIAPIVPPVRIVEVYPYAVDCSPFDTARTCADYVKLHNPTNHAVALDEYVLRTDSASEGRTSANTIMLEGITIPPGGYYTISRTDDERTLSLTNSGGYVWLEDIWATVRYEETLTRYEYAGMREQGLAWALVQDGVWTWTSTPTPEGANSITNVDLSGESLADCPAGKYRNPETNRCRSIEEAVNALAACPEGQERNLVTNRCRSIALLAKATLTPCKEGQERNPETNRCRSIASAVAEMLPCDEGWERNPDTRRCRKIKNDTMPAAAFPVEPVAASVQSVATWWILGGVGVLALGYAGWEWRHEIAEFLRKIRIHGVGKE